MFFVPLGFAPQGGTVRLCACDFLRNLQSVLQRGLSFRAPIQDTQVLHFLHILPGIPHRLSKNVLTSVYKAQSVASRVEILGDVHHLLDERPCVP